MFRQTPELTITKMRYDLAYRPIEVWLALTEEMKQLLYEAGAKPQKWWKWDSIVMDPHLLDLGPYSIAPADAKPEEADVVSLEEGKEVSQTAEDQAADTDATVGSSNNIEEGSKETVSNVGDLATAGGDLAAAGGDLAAAGAATSSGSRRSAKSSKRATKSKGSDYSAGTGPSTGTGSSTGTGTSTGTWSSSGTGTSTGSGSSTSTGSYYTDSESKSSASNGSKSSSMKASASRSQGTIETVEESQSLEVLAEKKWIRGDIVHLSPAILLDMASQNNAHNVRMGVLTELKKNLPGGCKCKVPATLPQANALAKMLEGRHMVISTVRYSLKKRPSEVWVNFTPEMKRELADNGEDMSILQLFDSLVMHPNVLVEKYNAKATSFLENDIESLADLN
jgi:hypothetical protein